MGSCLSRKRESSSSSSLDLAAPVSVAAKESILATFKSFDANEEVKIKKKVAEEEKDKKEVVVEEENAVKKEIFFIKHRKSHDKDRALPSTPTAQKNMALAEDSGNSTNTTELGTSSNVSNLVVRTSSCTKEEVDAILIQCGRLSRSNSSGKVAYSGRKYSGSKRSYDLDQDQDVDHHQVDAAAANSDARKRGNGGSYCNDDEDDEMGGAERRQHRQRHRQSGRPSPSSSQGRRRTPSRERDQRSGSRERGNGTNSSGRRVSRSPGRRSETNPIANPSNGTGSDTSNNNRPGKKMVSVPATVSSLTMDKSNIGVEPQAANGVKRISVKRNVGGGEAGSRSAASPRSQSPARTNAKGGGSNENNQQQPSLSRSSSRKAEQSPYRRNPLSEIDTNSLVYAQATGNNTTANNNSNSRAQTRNKELEGKLMVKESVNVLNQAQMHKPNAEANSKINAQGSNKGVKEQTVTAEASGADLKPQTVARSRSARRSRDLDFNPETSLNPNPSYTALLLEDIQNFHQKSTNTNTNTPSFSVPACVTKACSIVEAVADLNSTTSSNLSCAFSDEKRSPTTVVSNLVGKKLEEGKDPFVESEVLVNDDLMEPSFHKYVTVRRGGNGKGTSSVEDMDGQESSGSNSFVGSSQQHWGYSTSSWEPNSADSTDRWTSRSNTRDEEEKSPLGFQKHTSSESGRDMEEARRGFSGQRNGIGRGRVGSSKNLNSTPIVAAAST
ncbi:uncharacterized protein At1g65710 [Ricinus communis]|uniref:Uncharacterized protein n=1 Tax=Ricinus communis TaxID=3988 RepID=B9SX38_RICCO|nr:uncharacterized protein At1g65710 [Ricinus communis]EEF31825.1 hypothetical protein RCOM_0303940 [Ricinus communis]|eukprot:XP_002530557.1 uncharacterized protein At1g65710 [Ricinus communis]